ncbi:HAMP domain-containing protein [Aetokthonos hydrillicola Thurmond2011]|uniref:Circadian input-output histidine kinase CikA n=1 Tax=Aetokthonos hydrillicola Thurmond2011 TaxID=2712845 RepID=A0AAP5IBQ3_9CYAN|nr:HAMP domain-containing protein [Aetokthonos hydrillicola]MBO3457788.1 HAMP domain-containing protein [Aetokthonos hydrillicola CCALA 1050]MBW4588354.1 HAMP domain-containing protein [Aetokthonos hydrillicola CCALA 1050]MDR9897162.1 HAMP domain-containing protein [Aetokthonos hydrillicola Thurmond2011]
MSTAHLTKDTDYLDPQQLLKTLVAVKKGNFSVRMPIDRTGITGKIADTLNDIIEINERMAAELDRISTVVGKEGKITQRASLGNVSGSWSACVDSVNTLITDLVQPTAETARVIRSVANGDLSQTIALEIEGRPLKGEFLQTAKIVNTMVTQLGSFASEVTRVAREVGTEGKLGVQAEVKGVAGTWKDLTDNVNLMAGNLTGQVRNIAEVATAIANGDLSKKITVDVKGEILDLKNTVNTMVDQLNSFASEVTRVAREVGTEGKLGVQAEVKGVAGTWKDLTDNVNLMAGNLTAQVRNIAEVTTAVAMGDLSKQITVDVKGEILELKNTVNIMVGQLNSFASEVTRVAREVGEDGKLGGQAEVKGVAGTWKDLTDSVNFMAGSLTAQVRNIAVVTTAVATGDLSKKITVDVKGEILELKNTINTMVDQLNSFASEVTRVAREVGSEGKLGAQAEVKGVAGTWKDLTDSVNMMAGNLTGQVRNIAEVATAIANGDLSKKITVEVKGEILELKNTINVMVDQLNSFASEVTRVAREVGSEGKLGGQADVRGVAGTWKDLTDSVNMMAGNLTGQVRNIAEVATAIANGDLSKKITVEVKGEILELKNTINVMVDQLNSFASEVTRVAREVGSEGKLGGQADVRGVAGTWKDLTESVNFMAGSLTAQVRNIAEVTTAVANGDLSKKITVDVKGEILELKNTINIMVDQLNSFASEVTRVAREVGSEGKLGVQAEVRGVAGTWKDLTDSVNSMAGNLTAQVRNIAEVTTAVAKGDLSKKITVDVKGEILALKNTINIMVDQLNSFASEVTRVAREVGTEGKLGVQAEVRGVAGTWKDLTDNVNLMAGNLTAQVRNIAEVATAIAKGDLSKKITVDVKGEILELKNTINVMVDQLSSFASEVTKVAREVGSEGKLGVQADVKDVAGTWKDLTESVNFMAGSLTAQVRNIAEVTTAVANGDLSKKITVDVKGEILELKNTINTMVDQLNSFASEVTRVAREVGTEGKLGVQAFVRGVGGTWKDLTDNVNSMAGNLTAQVRNIAEVTKAVANGDLSKKITVDVKGEILELKNTINVMVDQLSSFASEVTRVAREVGTEGKLGGQAQVRGVAGTWKDLTDNVNSMASNLTAQVRGIAVVVTAVAKGELKRKLMLEAKGEIQTLADTINEMIDTLATFAEQVTTVAREVGIEGQLGGQARVPGASGTWRDLTDNVNELAANLTTQVRAIAEVAIAVTNGDLTRSIAVEAQGEVAVLKDNINQMIANLRETTQKNTEQDWLKTNLAKFTRMLQGQRDLETVSKLILSELAPLVSAQHGVFFLMESNENQDPLLKLLSTYAYRERKHLANRFHLGEGLVGQCALEKERILLTQVPEDYIKISSGLGEATPLNAVVLPVLFEGQVTAVIELASFHKFSDIHLSFFDQLTESIAIVLNTIAASMRTEELLKQSQSLAEELQSQQNELRETNQRLELQAQSLKASEELLKQQQDQLRQTNDELEQRSQLLAKQNQEVEQKNQEIELARQSLEDKAAQLALTSKYKSQFLANMSHELRTPLNSLLLLAKLFADNTDNNLTSRQVEYGRTIYSAGTDLLALINDILDLSKIESGTMSVNFSQIRFTEVASHVEGNFRQIAQTKGLNFTIELDRNLPLTLYSDVKRLQQVLKNLLANAFKFTESGEVRLRIFVARQGWNPENEQLNRANTVIAFAVSDTGIGIAVEKQKIIFEAFQQADGTTSRKYGGTGLGLSISREIAQLLGGEIQLASTIGQGSTFTLYLPQNSSPGHGTIPETTALVSLAPEQVSTIAPQYSFTTFVSSENNTAPAHEEGKRLLLIVEDDARFAQILLDMSRHQGFNGTVAHNGSMGLSIARQLMPDAIMLDIRLPLMDGWTVLDRLKHDPKTRHIPVYLVSVELGGQRGLKLGALAYLQKPVENEVLTKALTDLKGFVERQVKHLLVVAHDEAQCHRIVELVGNSDVSTIAVSSGADALVALRSEHFDCLVLSLPLPDLNEFKLLEDIQQEVAKQDHGSLPIILYTDHELTQAEETHLKQLSETSLVKNVRSPERLLAETVLYLHRVSSNLTESQRQTLERLYLTEPSLSGKKVLIVDDDIRNIFALTSTLERHEMEVLYAENGADGIVMLQNNPDIDVVLMDIMMPGMDGYEAIRTIRQISQFALLPIFALTAKAMPGDRELCLAAGASNYVAKPVDVEELLSLLRVYLSQ